MRLLQFYKNGQVCLGIEAEKGIIDVAEEAKKQNLHSIYLEVRASARSSGEGLFGCAEKA